MSSYTALLDANVLYPAPVRDLLLQLEPHRDRAGLERTRDLVDSNARAIAGAALALSEGALQPRGFRMLGSRKRRFN